MAVVKRHLGKAAEPVAIVGFAAEPARLADASLTPANVVFGTAPDDDAGGEDRGHLTQRLTILATQELRSGLLVVGRDAIYRIPLALATRTGPVDYDGGSWEAALTREPAPYVELSEPADGATLATEQGGVVVYNGDGILTPPRVLDALGKTGGFVLTELNALPLAGGRTAQAFAWIPA